MPRRGLLRPASPTHTTLTAKSLPNALSIVAVSERHTIFDPGPCVYMDKIACAADLADVVDPAAPIETTLANSQLLHRHAAHLCDVAVDQIDGEVDFRACAVAHLFAVVKHRRLVLLSLANDNRAAHRDGAERTGRTAARRSQASRGSALLTASLALGLLAVLPLLLLSGVVPLTGVAVVPIVAIVLGNTMTAVAVAARLALDTLRLRAGEVEAALSLGMSERDSRMEIIGESATNALLPNLDSTRTVGLVTLPGAFVGVLLSTGSATQAGAVQILVLIALLLSQTCGVAATIELVARGMITRVTW